jgi:hypothetical protein
MKFIDYVDDALSTFSFLIDEYSFVLAEKRLEHYGTFLTYIKENIKVYLGMSTEMLDLNMV